MRHLLTGVSALALVVAVSTAASAQQANGGFPWPQGDSFKKSYNEDVDVKFNNDVNVKLSKDISVKKEVLFTGTVTIDGRIGDINEAAFAVIDNKQVLNHNDVIYNERGPDPRPRDPLNFANLSAGGLNGANGNVGMNVAAGDVNVQDNAATISYAGGRDHGGGNGGDPRVRASVDAEAFVMQESYENTFEVDSGVAINIAHLHGEFLNGANGNLGLNVAAGALNAQKNGLAIAATQGDAVLAEASAASLQQADGNDVTYGGLLEANVALLGAGIGNLANGNVGINVAAGSNNLQANTLTIATTGIGN